MYYNDYLEEVDTQESINEYLTPREVMDLLYIKKNTLYRLLNSGELKGFRVGRQWRVTKASLQSFSSGGWADRHI